MAHVLGLLIVLSLAFGGTDADRERELAKASDRLTACAKQALKGCTPGYARERQSVATLVTDAWIPEHLVSVAARETACESLRMSGGVPRELRPGERFAACD